MPNNTIYERRDFVVELRKIQEAREAEFLSPYACKSADSRGRARAEEPCDIRTDFQRDRDRILHCKAFRRLKHKTQVFISPEGDHYRTRLTHTLEVSQIARTISRALSLNEDLTEAIALGHDLGHTPFGHAGERVLNQICTDGFEHSDQSLRVVERLEKDGAGLNLTWEVRDGIQNHRSSGRPGTLEGKVVQLSDKIAYINHDIDDAMRAGLLERDAIPKALEAVIGDTSSKRINAMIRDTIENSMNRNEVKMSPLMKETMQKLRQFMFQTVYTDRRAEESAGKVENVIRGLYGYVLEHPAEMHGEFETLLREGEPVERVATDYIACMTDRFAINKYQKWFIPESWGVT